MNEVGWPKSYFSVHIRGINEEYSCTHIFLFSSEGVFTTIQCLEFMMRLKIRPAPDSAVDHMRQTLPVGHLESPIQTPRYCDTLARLTWTTQTLLQCLKSSLRHRITDWERLTFEVQNSDLIFLQLLDQSINSLLSPLLLLIPLLPSQQLLHCRRGEGEEGVETGHCYEESHEQSQEDLVNEANLEEKNQNIVTAALVLWSCWLKMMLEPVPDSHSAALTGVTLGQTAVFTVSERVGRVEVESVWSRWVATSWHQQLTATSISAQPSSPLPFSSPQILAPTPSPPSSSSWTIWTNWMFSLKSKVWIFHEEQNPNFYSFVLHYQEVRQEWRLRLWFLKKKMDF